MNQNKSDFEFSPDERNITIALEAAVAGGSLAIFSGKSVIGEWTGKAGSSKSEDVLAEIQKLLKSNKINSKSIGRIIFSDGAGSLTGLRIGAALAKGLAKSLACACRSESILDALLFLLKIEKRDDFKTVTAVPSGGNRAAWQVFQTNKENKRAVGNLVKIKQSSLSESAAARITTVDVFFEELEKISFKNLVLHRHLFDKPETNRLRDKIRISGEGARIIDAGANMAALMGQNFIERDVF